MTPSRSTARAGRAAQLQGLLEHLLGAPLPVRLRAWDGSEAGPPGAPVLEVRDRRALRHLLWRPDELGLARAWVAGDLDLPPGGDLYAMMESLLPLVEAARGSDRPRPRLREHLGTLLRLGALGPRPPLPPEEARELTGRRHSLTRDRQAIRHHYDVGNEFYRLVLGPSLVYSCAYWPPGTPDLESAQANKLDLVCRKLGLRPGMRLLDVGCGWGSMLLHAARHYGVHGVGITLSQEQAAAARERIAQEGLADRLEVRIQDYREVPDGPFDAISSIGMAEHVGAEQYLAYAGKLYDLLAPEGRLLNHQIARRPTRPGERYELSPFIAAYVFPDGELMPIGGTVSLLERAGFEVRDVEALREHYAVTLRAWVSNLEADWERAVKLVGRGRARVWRLYMAASAVAFESNSIGVNQVLAVRTRDSGRSGMPRSRACWQPGSDAPSADGASADGPSV
ncbi:class I SAM-dependent methyltransferase [Streptacidiphilus monticola]|uniref:Class I SAM-dependent methyltransferase n=1 Tax=Streptacidiphilus monticola TaxID=2161674 RepID=A0ABW1G9U8_9ACTN